jgi:site-specific recombinase XerD
MARAKGTSAVEADTLASDWKIARQFLGTYSESTRNHYAMVIDQWFSWCAGRGFLPSAVTRVDIEEWARELEEVGGLMASTIAGKLTVLSQMYKFAVRAGYMKGSPAQYVTRPIVPSGSSTSRLTHQEVQSLLKVAKESDMQDHAVVCLLLLNGLGVSELCSLNIEDVGEDDGFRTIEVMRTKSHERETLALAPRTSLAVEQTTYGRTSGPLFMLRGDKPIDRRGVDRIVKRLAKKAGIDKRISPQALRHTYVNLALDAGVSVRSIRQSIGTKHDRSIKYHDANRRNLAQDPTHMVSAFVEA